jgi:hypothetical protein
MRLAKLEATTAGLFGVLTVLTLVLPDWIEAVFGIEPDGGNGSLEWLIVTALGLVTLVLTALSFRSAGRARQAQDS